MIRTSLLITAILVLNQQIFAQKATIDGKDANANAITTAVPFLTISSDSRSGAMGDIGVATSADANSLKYNVAKYPFAKEKFAFGVSYTPWLKKLASDINLLNVSGFYKVSPKQSISGSLTYFSLGSIDFLDDYANFVTNYTPNEFAIKLGYSRLLTDNLSLGVALGYIYSNLTGGYSNSSSGVNAGQAAAANIGLFYHKPFEIEKKKAFYDLGFSISDIGNKMSYSSGAEKSFLPTTMRLGAGFGIDIDDYNSIAASVEFSKLLVPTPPVYSNSLDANNNKIITSGKDPNISVGTALFQSFYDAPGGSSEEFKEVMWAFGLEYWYAKQFALRGGYFHESAIKGNRKFFSLGLGIKYQMIGIDFSYLIPNGSNSPLANTMRFTIYVDLND